MYKISCFRSVIGQFLLVTLALTGKTPRQCAVQESGGVIEMLTAEAVSVFANFCAKSSVAVNGDGPRNGNATMQKKMAVLAHACRLAMRLLKDGYLDATVKSKEENEAVSSRKLEDLRSSLFQCVTNVGKYQKLAQLDAAHHRVKLEKMRRGRDMTDE